MMEARSLICSGKPSVDVVMQCLLGLRPLESELYFELLKAPGTPAQLSERIGKSRSLVQRALQNLVGYGLAYRRVVSRERGRAFLYEAVPKEEVKKTLRSAVKQWLNAVEEAISDW
ncbi:helix-turn-helix domain-containing protein [Candidatus Pyrohabitans sp.]